MKETMSQENMNEVQVGHPAPDFVARDLSGNDVRLSTLTGGRKALLLFYRGGWCPFCNEQLAAIAADYQSFKELNATVVAVSGEEVEKGKGLLQKLRLPFVLLSDTSFDAIDRYGVRAAAPSETMRASGITKLPKPSAFVIDGAGIVRYRYVGKNAPDRPRNEDLLRALGESDEPMRLSSKAFEEDACELPGGGNR
jgi:peroxiredoxin